MAGDIGFPAVGNGSQTDPATPPTSGAPSTPASGDDGSPYAILKSGSDKASLSLPLLDLWKANGQPAEMGFAAVGFAYARLGTITRPAGENAICGLKATRLHLEGAKLMGRIATTATLLNIDTSSSTKNKTTPRRVATVELQFGVWYNIEDYLTAWADNDGTTSVHGQLTVAFRSGGRTAQFSYRATGSAGDDTFLEWNSSQVIGSEGIPGPKTQKAAWRMPYTTGQFRFLNDGNFVRGNGAHCWGQKILSDASKTSTTTTTTTVESLWSALNRSTWKEYDARTQSTGAAGGMDWYGVAESLARAGQWVRRNAWSDTTQQMRFEAGRGSTAAVLVIGSSSIATRPVRNSEFGVAEFSAGDWVLATPLAPSVPLDFDLTTAKLELVMGAAHDWVLFRSKAESTGSTDGSGDTSGSGVSGDIPAPPSSGTAVLMSQGGQMLWAPTQEFSCPT